MYETPSKSILKRVSDPSPFVGGGMGGGPPRGPPPGISPLSPRPNGAPGTPTMMAGYQGKPIPPASLATPPFAHPSSPTRGALRPIPVAPSLQPRPHQGPRAPLDRYLDLCSEKAQIESQLRMLEHHMQLVDESKPKAPKLPQYGLNRMPSPPRGIEVTYQPPLTLHCLAGGKPIELQVAPTPPAGPWRAQSPLPQAGPTGGMNIPLPRGGVPGIQSSSPQRQHVSSGYVVRDDARITTQLNGMNEQRGFVPAEDVEFKDASITYEYMRPIEDTAKVGPEGGGAPGSPTRIRVPAAGQSTTFIHTTNSNNNSSHQNQQHQQNQNHLYNQPGIYTEDTHVHKMDTPGHSQSHGTGGITSSNTHHYPSTTTTAGNSNNRGGSSSQAPTWESVHELQSRAFQTIQKMAGQLAHKEGLAAAAEARGGRITTPQVGGYPPPNAADQYYHQNQPLGALPLGTHTGYYQPDQYMAPKFALQYGYNPPETFPTTHEGVPGPGWGYPPGSASHVSFHPHITATFPPQYETSSTSSPLQPPPPQYSAGRASVHSEGAGSVSGHSIHTVMVAPYTHVLPANAVTSFSPGGSGLLTTTVSPSGSITVPSRVALERKQW